MSEGYSEFGLLQRRDGVAGGGVCLRDSGILIEFLAGLFTAGHSIEEIAKQYHRTPEEIEAAMRFVVLARGRNLTEKRAARIVERHIPLLPSRYRPSPKKRARKK